jgi:hypothetical protein
MAMRVSTWLWLGWTVEELLSFRVPLPRWAPRQERGQRSKATQALCLSGG